MAKPTKKAVKKAVRSRIAAKKATVQKKVAPQKKPAVQRKPKTTVKVFHGPPENARATTEIDELIARKLRGRRQTQGLSQHALAEMLGITFQQIQKYEKAANRVSASRLYAIAVVLEVNLVYFFTEADDQED